MHDDGSCPTRFVALQALEGVGLAQPAAALWLRSTEAAQKVLVISAQGAACLVSLPTQGPSSDSCLEASSTSLAADSCPVNDAVVAASAPDAALQVSGETVSASGSCRLRLLDSVCRRSHLALPVMRVCCTAACVPQWQS